MKCYDRIASLEFFARHNAQSDLYFELSMSYIEPTTNPQVKIYALVNNASEGPSVVSSVVRT